MKRRDFLKTTLAVIGAAALPIGIPRRERLVASFGDGSDGDIVISDTVWLQRHMYYGKLTFKGKGRIVPNGYLIHVRDGIYFTGKKPSIAVKKG